MRKIVPFSLFLLLSIFCVPTHGAVTHPQSSPGYCTSSAHGGNIAATCNGVKTLTFSFTPSGTNDGIVFMVECGSTSVTPTAVSLIATGWSFTQQGAIGGSTTSGFGATFSAYSPNTSAASITVTWTTTGNCGQFMGDLTDDYSGENTSNFVDATSGASVSTATSGGCSTAIGVTPTVANDGLWFACYDSVTAVGGSYSQGCNDTQGDWSEYQILSGGSGTAQHPAWTSSGAYITYGIAIKPAAATTSASQIGVFLPGP